MFFPLIFNTLNLQHLPSSTPALSRPCANNIPFLCQPQSSDHPNDTPALFIQSRVRKSNQKARSKPRLPKTRRSITTQLQVKVLFWHTQRPPCSLTLVEGMFLQIQEDFLIYQNSQQQINASRRIWLGLH
jgi:hypothetical protein